MRRTWIFQANPNRYRIFDSLRNQSQELWNLRQHSRDVKVGDRVLIWICGSDAGVYAVGTVMSIPVLISDSQTGVRYWVSPWEGRQARPRVVVRYDRVRLDRPLMRAFIEWDPRLAGLKILRSPRGTNFEVSEQEWLALEEWLNQP